MTKDEWIAKYIGDPKEWKIIGDQILDTVRPNGYQVVGTIKRSEVVIITWRHNGSTTQLETWSEES